MKNITTTIFCSRMIAILMVAPLLVASEENTTTGGSVEETFVSSSDVARLEEKETLAIKSLKIAKAERKKMRIQEDMEIAILERKLRKCLVENIFSTILVGSLQFPEECAQQAREFIIEAGYNRAFDVIDDFDEARK